MTPTPPPVPTTVPGFVVLDADLPDRPPLAHAGDYDAALATIDATGTVGWPFHLDTINGMRPAQR